MGLESLLQELRGFLKERSELHEEKWILDFLRSIETESEKESFLKGLIERKAKNEPLAYILGNASFRGRDYCVGPGVLIPRMESEWMVEALLDARVWSKKELKKIKIADLGAGSGALGLSLLEELLLQNYHVELFLVERSSEAWPFLEKNVENLRKNFSKAEIFVLKESWCGKIGENFDLILSNPPYISEEEYQSLDLSVKNYEPKSALTPDFSLDDKKALNSYLEIIDKSESILKIQGLLFFELGLLQQEALMSTFKKREKKWHNPFFKQDLSGFDRFIGAYRKV